MSIYKVMCRKEKYSISLTVCVLSEQEIFTSKNTSNHMRLSYWFFSSLSPLIEKAHKRMNKMNNKMYPFRKVKTKN